MSALLTLGSVALGPATTPLATTPACVPLSTCKSTVEITAWVRRGPSLREGVWPCPAHAQPLGCALGNVAEQMEPKRWEPGLGFGTSESTSASPHPCPYTVHIARASGADACLDSSYREDGWARGGGKPSRALSLPAMGQDPRISVEQGFAPSLQPLWAPLCVTCSP